MNFLTKQRKPKKITHVTVKLIRLYTLTSGEAIKETGEWYISVNNRRWPDVGYLYLKANSEFKLNSELYSGFHENVKDYITLDFRVKEADLIKDDTMLSATVKLRPERGYYKIHELNSKDGKVKLTVQITIDEIIF